MLNCKTKCDKNDFFFYLGCDFDKMNLFGSCHLLSASSVKNTTGITIHPNRKPTNITLLELIGNRRMP